MQRLEHVEAGPIGQHHVEQDEVGPELPEQVDRGVRVGGPRHLESVERQVVADDLGQELIVLDDQNARVHDEPSLAAGGPQA